MKTQEAADFLNPTRKVRTMENQELKIQEQNIQINNQNNQGENDMTNQLEQPVETNEIGDAGI